MIEPKRRVGPGTWRVLIPLVAAGMAFACCQPCPAGEAERAAKLRQAAALKREAETLRSQEKFVEAADALMKAAFIFYGLRDLHEARKQLEDALAIRRSKLAKDDLTTAETLNNLGTVHTQLREFGTARKYYEEALTIRRRKLPEDHPRLADGWSNLANVLRELGEFDAARKHYQEALAVRRRALPRNELSIAQNLNSLAIVEKVLGEPAVARKHLEEALALRRAVLPSDHPLIASALHNLGGVLRDLGDLAAARKHFEDALAIYRKVRPSDDRRVADTLNNLGAVLDEQGERAAAHEHLKEALALGYRTLPKDHPQIADSLNNLGSVLHGLGDLAAARRSYEQALAIRRRRFPGDDPVIAQSLNNLAAVLHELGDLATARKHLEDALAIYRGKLGPRHPLTADALNNLGGVLHHLGDLAAARKHYEQALAIYRGKLPKDHPLIAAVRNNLGVVCRDLGDLAAARTQHEQALAIHRSQVPKDAVAIADSLSNLGLVLHELRELTAAREHHEKALRMRRGTLARDDPRIAESLTNLANVVQDQGELAVARTHYEEALRIFRSTLPSEHKSLHYPLYGLMRLESRAGNAAKSRVFLQEMVYLNLARQERDGLARSEREQLNRAAWSGPLLDYLVQELVRAGQFEQAYDAIVAAKGAVTARQRWLHLARDFTDDRTMRLLADLRAVGGQLLRAGLEVPDGKNQPARDPGDRLRTLTRRRDELERALIAASAAFKAEKQRVRRGHAEIAGALPAHAVLIDFVEYVPVKANWQALKVEPEAPRLGAFVVRSGPKLQWVDLGPAKDMAALVDRWRSGHGVWPNAAKEPSPAAELSKRLWQPIEPHVAGAKLILVAPEGPLTGLPLGALPGKKAGSYLLEEYAFANVPTPQLLPDLLAKTDPRFERPLSMLLVGDVDFGVGKDFDRLPGSSVEINDIQVKFRDTFTDGKLTVLRKDKATKPAFAAAVKEPRYLHLATHGMFADPSHKSVFAPEHRARALRTPLAFDRQVVGEHPGLLCGIVFAGANRKKEEAILTALEASEMELRGVELVVLSACDTGLGRVAGGEGVLGLQRAFQVAGARTTITSLWKVDDAATQRLMSRFYENLWDKKMSKVEALRQAQLWMMREGGTRGLDLPPDTQTLPPRYWAAFVLSGDWR